MIRFIEKPNLPKNRVHSVICGQTDAIILNHLEKLGINVIHSVPNKNIDARISNHVDLATIHIGDNKVVVDKYQTALNEELSRLGFEVIVSENSVEGEYPCDCILNQAIIGEYHIGNQNICDNTILNCTDLKRINVKQGYAKCSIIVVNENSILTDDVSIYENSLKNGLNSLLISKGDVFLDGYKYGFIGGAAAKISENEILFFGDIQKHCDYKRIYDYLNSRGIKIAFIENFRLTDIGGLVLLTEYK